MDAWVQAIGTIRCLGKGGVIEHSSPGGHFDDLHVDVFRTTASAFSNSKDYVTWACECYMDLQEQSWLTMI